MISYQRPCKTGSASVYKNLAQPINKVPIVDLVFKYGLALNPPDNDVVQCSGRINSVFSRHVGRLTVPWSICQLFTSVPLISLPVLTGAFWTSRDIPHSSKNEKAVKEIKPSTTFAFNLVECPFPPFILDQFSYSLFKMWPHLPFSLFTSVPLIHTRDIDVPLGAEGELCQ